MPRWGAWQCYNGCLLHFMSYHFKTIEMCLVHVDFVYNRSWVFGIQSLWLQWKSLGTLNWSPWKAFGRQTLSLSHIVSNGSFWGAKSSSALQTFVVEIFITKISIDSYGLMNDATVLALFNQDGFLLMLQLLTPTYHDDDVISVLISGICVLMWFTIVHSGLTFILSGNVAQWWSRYDPTLDLEINISTEIARANFLRAATHLMVISFFSPISSNSMIRSWW